jgi:hypothetical protein
MADEEAPAGSPTAPVTNLAEAVAVQGQDDPIEADIRGACHFVQIVAILI